MAMEVPTWGERQAMLGCETSDDGNRTILKNHINNINIILISGAKLVNLH